MSRCQARGEILAARKERLERELAEAKERATRILGHAQWRFGTLQNIFASHVFETEKTALSTRMIAGCPQLSLEQTVLFLRPVADACAMEIPLSQDVEIFIAAGNRLLATITEAGFEAPEFGPPPPAGKGASTDEGETASETLVGPFTDRGLTQREIDREWTRIREEDPSLTMAQAGRKLAELHPEIYMTREQVLELSKPLSEGSIRSAARPVQEEPQVPGDRVFETLSAQ